VYLFAKQGSIVQSKENALPASLENPIITCRNCNAHITDPDCQIQKEGAFCHTFANPAGHVFEICCFTAALGCSFIPPPFSDFSWFTGYDWNIGVCRDCTTHLGWFYRSPKDQFWGLIPDKLIFPHKM
jgi:hypothetical protein